jgi:mannose-1-phosphate guanylyltransferase
MNNIPYVLIMAGGVGSRFWPASREHLPKQFLDITGSGKNLLRETVDRYLHFIPIENIFVITNAMYVDLVRETIPEMDNDQIIGEPSRNNTAPAVTLASLKLSKLNPDAVCIVAPADHVIHNEEEFRRVIKLAVAYASSHESIVTLGIEPTRADTGYGYIEFDKTSSEEVFKVKSFREKPNREMAEQYLNQGTFVWNAGIFVWSLKTILDDLKKHASSIYDLLIAGMEQYNTPEEEDFVAEAYPKTEKISVDHAILELSENVYTIPCHISWSDLGTWNSLYEFLEKNEAGNVLLSDSIFMKAANNNLVLSKKGKLVAVKGLDGHIIIDTEDCLMIYPMNDEQEIKALKEDLEKNGYKGYL